MPLFDAERGVASLVMNTKKFALSIYRSLQIFVGITGWTFAIQRSRPSKKWIVKYVEANQVWMRLDLSESLDGSYAQNSVDIRSINFIKNKLQYGGVFVDIGANQGFYTLLVRKNFPEVEIIAIEPDPYSITKLKINLDLNDFADSKTTIIEKAAGTKRETLELMINDAGNRAGSSVILDQRAFTKKQVNSVVKVLSEPLLDILKESGATKVTCMKIDIEGYEFPVLSKFFEDADELLWPRSIVLEAESSVIGISGGSPINLVFGLGYELIDHEEVNYMFELNRKF